MTRAAGSPWPGYQYINACCRLQLRVSTLEDDLLTAYFTGRDREVVTTHCCGSGRRVRNRVLGLELARGIALAANGRVRLLVVARGDAVPEETLRTFEERDYRAILRSALLVPPRHHPLRDAHCLG